jgi:protein phosphatase
MGGHAAGEKASSIAVESIERFVLHTTDWFFRLSPEYEDDLADELKAGLMECQEQIMHDQKENPRNQGMGTTITMAYVLWPRMFVVHVGDSRLYVARSGKVVQLTTDHTVAQQYVEAGRMSPEEASESRWSHMLWNAVGGQSSSLHLEVHRATLEPGDRMLLCTDGLSNYHDLESIGRLIASAPPKESCLQLIADANEAGGKDNITGIVVAFS